ncbi:MAG: HAD family hydrolase [Bacteroidia bacterium]|nr:HAD family hydrolase [Bacteroidia bacterium]MCF8447057.1 HAD family hydrolase [Bacteroidia bacterium]
MRNKIKHYSFDLWLTLIRSNPEFKKERIRHFTLKYNSCNKSEFEIKVIFETVDKMCNAINQKTGGNICTDEMYLMTLYLINEGNFEIQNFELNKLKLEMEYLFFKYPPVPIYESILNELIELKKRTKATFNISSNTAFIDGKLLRILLNNIGFAPLFEFQIYSDEIGFSKPNLAFYSKMYSEVELLHKQLNRIEIAHIGDNIIADIEGAKSFGINAIDINKYKIREIIE